jgi:hypothetical protein
MDKESAQAWALGTAGAAQGVWKYYKPELATAALGASVLAYDLLCEPGGTFSEVADKAIDRHPIATRVAIGAVALHVANMIPERYDIVTQAFKRIKKHPR